MNTSEIDLKRYIIVSRIPFSFLLYSAVMQGSGNASSSTSDEPPRDVSVFQVFPFRDTARFSYAVDHGWIGGAVSSLEGPLPVTANEDAKKDAVRPITTIIACLSPTESPGSGGSLSVVKVLGYGFILGSPVAKSSLKEVVKREIPLEWGDSVRRVGWVRVPPQPFDVGASSSCSMDVVSGMESLKRLMSSSSPTTGSWPIDGPTGRYLCETVDEVMEGAVGKHVPLQVQPVGPSPPTPTPQVSAAPVNTAYTPVTYTPLATFQCWVREHFPQLSLQEQDAYAFAYYNAQGWQPSFCVRE